MADELSVSPIEYSENAWDKEDILTLPIEMVKNILSYVDEPSRRKVVLVCHTFYELICELERDKIPLDLSFSEVAYFVSSIETVSNHKKYFRFMMMTSTIR